MTVSQCLKSPLSPTQGERQTKTFSVLFAKLPLVPSVPRGSGRKPAAHVRLEAIHQQPGALSVRWISKAPAEVFRIHLSFPASSGIPAVVPGRTFLPFFCFSSPQAKHTSISSLIWPYKTSSEQSKSWSSWSFTKTHCHHTSLLRGGKRTRSFHILTEWRGVLA